MKDCKILRGDCVKVLRTIDSGSIDLVLTDPPYPCIKRSYGTWTEAEWWALMRAVVPECMRVLKPTGSAVFILQPNSERIGRMRTWLWEFMAWVGKEWGIVQDAYWWNNCALPGAQAIQGELLRASAKACVWVGPANCYRNQQAILDRHEKAWMRRAENKVDERIPLPSGNGVNRARCLDTVNKRGGTTPFNVLAMGNGHKSQMGGVHGHGAATPINLCSWWTRYLCPPGGTVLDPFAGSGTVPLAALKLGRKAVGIERVPEYVEIARRRIAEAARQGVAA